MNDKLTDLERLGIPKGERNNTLRYKELGTIAIKHQELFNFR